MDTDSFIRYLADLILEANNSDWKEATEHDFKVWEIKVRKFLEQVFGDKSDEVSEFQRFFFGYTEIDENYEQVNMFSHGMDDALAFLEGLHSHLKRFGEPKGLRKPNRILKIYKWIRDYVVNHTKTVLSAVFVAVISAVVISQLGIGDKENEAKPARVEPVLRILPVAPAKDIVDFQGKIDMPTGSLFDSTHFSSLSVTVENSGSVLTNLDSMLSEMPTSDDVLTSKKEFGFTLAPSDKVSIPIKLLLRKDLVNSLSLDLFFTSESASLKPVSGHFHKYIEATMLQGKWTVKVLSPKQYEAAIKALSTSGTSDKSD